jgi:hypothetical protein
MTAFLLIWSPRKWPWPELPDVVKRVADGEAVTDVWGCGVARSIQPGDRVFLHRVAQEPRGVRALWQGLRSRRRSGGASCNEAGQVAGSLPPLPADSVGVRYNFR